MLSDKQVREKYPDTETIGTIYINGTKHEVNAHVTKRFDAGVFRLVRYGIGDYFFMYYTHEPGMTGSHVRMTKIAQQSGKGLVFQELECRGWTISDDSHILRPETVRRLMEMCHAN